MEGGSGVIEERFYRGWEVKWTDNVLRGEYRKKGLDEWEGGGVDSGWIL